MASVEGSLCYRSVSSRKKQVASLHVHEFGNDGWRIETRMPLIELFHSSHQKIDSFWPFSHFGTRQAAVDNLDRRVRSEGLTDRRVGFIHRCRIDLPSELLQVRDFGTPRPLALLCSLIDEKPCLFDGDHQKSRRIFQNHRRNVLDLPAPRPNPRIPRLFMDERAYLAEVFLEIDVSVVEYVNSVEGNGAKSYVVIDTSLIKDTHVEESEAGST